MNEYRHTVKTTCKFCRREFDSFGLNKVCPNCDADMDKHFRMIRSYLEEFPNSSAAEICRDLEIPTALIKFFLKEERLEVKKNSGNHFLKCERCKKPISKGRYCFECEIAATRSDMKAVLVNNREEKEMEGEIFHFHSRRSL